MTSGQNIQTVYFMAPILNAIDIVNIPDPCHHPPPLQTGCKKQEKNPEKKLFLEE